MANDEAILIASVSNSRPLEMIDRAEILGGHIANGLVSCSLKRKRPPKIEIPNVLREISTDVFKGCTAQGQGDGPVCFTDSGVGVFSLKGKKKFMEDAYKIFASSNGNKVVTNTILVCILVYFYGLFRLHFCFFSFAGYVIRRLAVICAES